MWKCRAEVGRCITYTSAREHRLTKSKIDDGTSAPPGPIGQPLPSSPQRLPSRVESNNNMITHIYIYIYIDGSPVQQLVLLHICANH